MNEILIKYMFLVPIIIGIVFFILIIIKNINKENVSIIKKVGIFEKIFSYNNPIRIYYMKSLLKFYEIKFEKILKFKIEILILGFLLMVLVILTDISYETYNIKNKSDYKVSYIAEGNVSDRENIFKLEMDYIDKAILVFTDKKIKLTSINDFEQLLNLKLFTNIKFDGFEKEEVIKRLYIRVNEFYRIRDINVFMCILILLLLTFIPELILGILNTVKKADRKNELVFLKRLMIMCGSIKPVVFQDIINILIEKSNHYKKVLVEINKNINKNSNNSDEMYRYYIEHTNNLEEKLFFEKLHMANNYDFRLAITNIKNEFKISQKENDRNTKKQVEYIHIMGVLGIMILIFIWILFLIAPWMESFNMENIL